MFNHKSLGPLVLVIRKIFIELASSNSFFTYLVITICSFIVTWSQLNGFWTILTLLASFNLWLSYRLKCPFLICLKDFDLCTLLFGYLTKSLNFLWIAAYQELYTTQTITFQDKVEDSNLVVV